MNEQAENIADLEWRVDEDPRDLSRYSDLVDAYWKRTARRTRSTSSTR